MNPVSQRSNVRHREVKQLARGHTACSKRQSWEPRLSDSRNYSRFYYSDMKVPPSILQLERN